MLIVVPDVVASTRLPTSAAGWVGWFCNGFEFILPVAIATFEFMVLWLAVLHKLNVAQLVIWSVGLAVYIAYVLYPVDLWARFDDWSHGWLPNTGPITAGEFVVVGVLIPAAGAWVIAKIGNRLSNGGHRGSESTFTPHG